MKYTIKMYGQLLSEDYISMKEEYLQRTKRTLKLSQVLNFDVRLNCIKFCCSTSWVLVTIVFTPL